MVAAGVCLKMSSTSLVDGGRVTETENPDPCRCFSYQVESPCRKWGPEKEATPLRRGGFYYF